MEVYRIEKQQFLPTILDGIPGEKFSFRWNSKGHPIVYAAGSRSLALVEKMANIGMQYGGIPPAFFIAVIEIPNKAYRKISAEDLSENWNVLSEYSQETQTIGDAFLNSDELALYVPSVIVKNEYNILLNPKAIQDSLLICKTEIIDARLHMEPLFVNN